MLKISRKKYKEIRHSALPESIKLKPCLLLMVGMLDTGQVAAVGMVRVVGGVCAQRFVQSMAKVLCFLLCISLCWMRVRGRVGGGVAVVSMREGGPSVV